ncbi:MAG TPA: GntR family transcriptional regulator [Kineosporiaceae bacterium]|nr:GntR family transcriptional regulator [Kineosporiaceae bacterium]
MIGVGAEAGAGSGGRPGQEAGTDPGSEAVPAPATVLVGRIREAMLRGDYAPNQRLIEADLCEQHGVSRGTVRIALQELAADGLVEILRNKGARVRAISLAEAIEITEVRMALEGLAAGRAAERVSPEEAEELVEIGESMRAAFARSELLRYSDLNARLHRRVREISAHRTTATIIERLGAQVIRHQFRLALQPGRPAVSLPQHERIIEAVVARDPVAAEAAMRAHLASVVQALQATAQEQATPNERPL